MLSLVTQETPEHALPKQLVWDGNNPTEVQEAMDKIKELVGQGFAVEYVTVGEAKLSPPPRSSTELLVRVLDDNGDSRITWDRRDPKQCEEARRKFDEYLRKGYRAYVCRSDGSKGARVETFDALLEEVIVAPGQPGDRGTGEYHPREAVLVPPTAPS